MMMTGFVGALAAVNPDREALFIIISVFAGLGVGGCIVPAATIGSSLLSLCYSSQKSADADTLCA